MGTRLIAQKALEIWALIRTISGDNAYELYLAHWQNHHENQGEPLTRREFYRLDQERKWSGVKRCC